MVLESMIGCVEELRARILRYGNVLRQNEMATRYVLIDPLLRELGWNTENPDQVRPEYRSVSGSADYPLLNNNKPTLLIEAKRLDAPLRDGLAQALNYCLTEGAPYFAVTDGRRWEIYETHRPAPIADRILVEFDLLGEIPADSVLKIQALWRNHMEHGEISLPVSLITSRTTSAFETSGMTGAALPTDTELPSIIKNELQKLPDGQLVLCPSHPNSVEFLETHKAWGFIRLRKTPKYFALYVSQLVYEIQFVGKVESVVDPSFEKSPVSANHPAYTPGKKLVVMKPDKLWRLAEPVTYGSKRAGKALQGPRLLTLSRLALADTLDDLRNTA